MSEDCNKTNCNYHKYLSADVRKLLHKCDAAMWTSGGEDGIYGIEMNPKMFAKFLKAYDKLKLKKADEK
jgi:hypothetical protein